MTTPPTPGALFVVGGRPYVDSQALHNLAHTHSVTPVAGGWRVQGADGEAVLCLGTSCPPLPDQRGALYEARAAQGTKLVDACALWLARGAAQLAGKYDHWPLAGGCGCGATCGCGPCKQRHGHADTGPRLSAAPDEEAAQYVLDAAPFKLRGYVPETEKREPSGFFLHLYLANEGEERRAATFEVEGKSALRIHWLVEPGSPTQRSEIVRTVDLLVQEAYDEENHRDPG